MASWHHHGHELSKLWETRKDQEAWRAAVHWGHKESDKTKGLNNQEPISSGFKVVVLEAATRWQHFFMSGSGSLRQPEP